MTTEATYRCRHCLARYTYYPSGCPYFCTELNDDRYCPECKTVIRNALKDVPQRIERFGKPYDGITLDELKERVAKQNRESMWVKVAAPSFDMKDPDNRNSSGWLMLDEDGLEVFYSYWSKKGDHRIEVEMERNVETGEEYPWKDIRNKY